MEGFTLPDWLIMMDDNNLLSLSMGFFSNVSPCGVRRGLGHMLNEALQRPTNNTVIYLQCKIYRFNGLVTTLNMFQQMAILSLDILVND